MPTEFQMPKLGLTMESGKILEWLVADGSEVTEGQPVLLIETDKVESEVESNGSGRLAHVGAVGETYECGVQIGWFLTEGESTPTGIAAPAASSDAPAPTVGAATPSPSSAPASTSMNGRLLASPNAKRVAAKLKVDLRAVRGTGPGGRIVSEDVEAAAAAGPVTAPASVVPAALVGSGALVSATIAGRQLAELLGVDLAFVPSASPHDPRRTKEDVAAYVRRLIAGTDRPAAATGRTGAATGKSDSAFPLLQEPTTTVAFKGMRRTIAARMHQALQEMAQLTLHMDVEMDAVVADRSSRKSKGSAPGYTDYVVAAAAKALKDHPCVNSQITGDGVAYLPAVNVGLAVAVDGGLIVPVIPKTDLLDLDELSAETSRLAEAARAGKLKFHELEGGTFSVTALGMFGVDGFTPVINPPNTAILGVGRLRDVVTLTPEGTPTTTSRLTLSLTWDHRAFDGAPAAEFAQTVKKHLESI